MTDLHDLKGRKAFCVCGVTRPSDRNLAFFVYMGPGGAWEDHCRWCGKYEEPHLRVTSVAPGAKVIDHKFEPREPRDTDEFYCGCRGWD